MKKMKTIPTLLGAAALLAVASSAWAADPPNGGEPKDYNWYNNYYWNYYYQNHYADGDGTGENWYRNMNRWADAPVKKQVQNQNRVVAPAPGPQAEPPGPRPNGPLTPADVQALVQQFQQAREAFMNQQRTLEQQMQTAGEQERQRLRDQLCDQMEEWKQQQARLREQLQDQCDRLAQQLRDHTRLMERVSNPGTPPSGSDGQNGSGPRGR